MEWYHIVWYLLSGWGRGGGRAFCLGDGGKILYVVFKITCAHIVDVLFQNISRDDLSDESLGRLLISLYMILSTETPKGTLILENSIYHMEAVMSKAKGEGLEHPTRNC